MDLQQIVGTARTVSQLFSNSRYGLDFYQREYSWEEAQVGELVEDLADRFRNEFDPDHERPDVESYRPYFLGPIVTVQRDGVRYLVDGQQRITTLSLLLIFLRNSLAETHPDEQASLDSLIFSSKYGRKTVQPQRRRTREMPVGHPRGRGPRHRRTARVRPEHLEAVRDDLHAIP